MHGRTLLQGHVARIDPPTNGDFSEHGTVDLASNTKEKKNLDFSLRFFYVRALVLQTTNRDRWIHSIGSAQLSPAIFWGQLLPHVLLANNNVLTSSLNIYHSLIKNKLKGNKYLEMNRV
jgi:hypothetical protein